MYHDVVNWVQGCAICQQWGPHFKHNELALMAFTTPFEVIMMDLVEGKPLTYHGNMMIITATDMATKWVMARPAPSMEAKHAMGFLVDEIVLRYRLPIRIIMDGGPAF